MSEDYEMQQAIKNSLMESSLSSSSMEDTRKKQGEKRKPEEELAKESIHIRHLKSEIAWEEAQVLYQRQSTRYGHEERLAKHDAKLKELNEKLQVELAKPPRPAKRQKKEEGGGEKKHRAKPIKARASDGGEYNIPVGLCRKFFKSNRDKFAFSKDLPTWDDLTTDGHRNEVIGEFLKVYDFHVDKWELKSAIEERKKKRKEEDEAKANRAAPNPPSASASSWENLYCNEREQAEWIALRDQLRAEYAAPSRFPVRRNCIPSGSLSWSPDQFNQMRPRLCDGCVGLPGFEHVCDSCARIITDLVQHREREAAQPWYANQIHLAAAREVRALMDQRAAEAVARWGDQWGVPFSAAAAAPMARPIPPTSSTLVKECTVCTESRPHDVLVPCGHVVVCRECVVHPQFDGKCPTCRVKIEKYQPVFLS